MTSDPQGSEPDLAGTGEIDSAFSRPTWLTLAGLMLGCAVEYLFYGRPLGVSLAVWAFLCLAAAFGLAANEGIRPSWSAYVLGASALVFSVLPVFRAEPLTALLDVAATIGLLILMVRTFRLGGLLDFGWVDLALSAVAVPLETLVRPWSVLGQAQARWLGGEGRRSTLVAIVRGLLLTLPVVIVFAILLASADLIYAEDLRQALSWLDIDRLFDVLGRLVVVLISGVILLGALVTALRRPSDRKLIGLERPIVAPFLGFTEAIVLLSGVILLFGSFVGVQFRYFFGGSANIVINGYTYAEYARRGFAELVLLACLTLGLIMFLGAWTHRKSSGKRRVFNGLSAVLVLFTGVILASAFERLLLYEQAYGFTRLRTYTHVAIIWIGLMFAAFLVLLVLGDLRRFGVACLVAAAGFALTLNILNVDVFILRQNIAYKGEIGQLDGVYLAQLSSDAVPELANLARSLPSQERAEILPGLACDLALLQARQSSTGWPSYTVSRQRALASLQAIESLLSPYQVEPIGGVPAYRVEVGDRVQVCSSWPF